MFRMTLNRAALPVLGLGALLTATTACLDRAGAAGPEPRSAVKGDTSGADAPGASPVAGDFTTDYLMGKFDPTSHPDFVEVAPEHASRTGMYLRRDTYEAFKKMYTAARRDSVRLIIISATRNFEAQRGIWEAKWTGARHVDGKDLSQTIPVPRERALKILEYSSMPGTSRHHWGTDMDLNSLNNHFFDEGEGKKIYDWLRAHAAAFGFCQPYSPKGPERPDGYNEERWHWSYMPVSRPLTNLAREELKNELIQGFKGAEAAPQIDVVKKYVLGINRACM